MTETQRWIVIAYTVIVAAWPIRHIVLSIVFRGMHFLDPSSPRYALPPDQAPLVSAIIPARNEQAFIAACLESVQAQVYPNLEILVVDDRSTDATASIVESIAAADPRIRLIRNETLPEGWTGKTHALHVAAAQARGQWLWFLDADTLHTPDSLSIVMEYARREKSSLASLLPEMRCETFWEKVVQPLMGVVLMRSFLLAQVNNNRSPVAFANGQYILVERRAYDAAGGHEGVKDRFVEDVYLARNVKHAGFPIRTAHATGFSSTRMYTSLSQLIRGWSRILYDALGRNPIKLLGKIIEPLIWSQTGTIALVAALVLLAIGLPGPFAPTLLVMAIVHLILQVSVLYRFYELQMPGQGLVAVWYPLAGFISDWILLRAIWSCFTGRVTWRGTAYEAGLGSPSPPSESPVMVESSHS